MYGLDNPSGISVMPAIAPAVSPTPLWFTEGGAGQPPSYPGQDWFNMHQAEHLNVLAAANITPVKSDLTQLSKAIKKLISDGSEGFLKTTNNLSEIKVAGAAAMTSARDNIGALSTTGTAAAATKLATARKIGGVDFDGTKDITLPFINTTDTNIQLAGILGSKGLQVFPLPGSPEGGEINLYDKDNKQAAYIDIDSGGNFRVVTDGLGTSVLISRNSGDVFIQKSLTATGTLKSAGIISEGTVYAGNNAAWLATDGNVYGPIWGGFLSTYLSNRGVRAWAAVQGNGTIISSFGFAAINRTNVGGYNFTMSTSNGAYAVTVGINGGSQGAAANAHSANIWNRSPNSFSIQNARDGGTSYDWTDWPEFYVIVVGP
ncbi:hypothetical protein [Yersinia intermedia]|uniref:hypothetical protein n=1 Tax=Yersinia intermedia TaxID=631 RepID=UPI003C7CBAA3